MTIRKVIFAVLLIMLTACIKSSIQSFTDPDYKNAIFNKLIVDTTALSDLSRIKATKIALERLKEAKIDAIDINDILVPTRSYTPEEAAKLLADSGYKNLISFKVTADTSNTYVSSVYSYTSVNGSAYGNNVQGTATTTSIPIVSSEGQTAVLAVIYDLNNNRKAWQATVITEAQGTAFVGNVDAIAHSAIGSIIDRLKEEGHLQDTSTK